MKELAAVGFGQGADRYERGRPSYPEPAVDLLVAELGLAGARVVDVGAGTGKLARQLAARGARVLGAEPLAAMRSMYASLTGRAIVGATAEALPLRSSSMRAVAVGQAFHWFEPATALAEFARVLEPGGWLVLLWNERDETVPWVGELTRIMHWDTCQPYPVGSDWRPTLAIGDRFEPAQRRGFEHVQVVDRATVVDRAASTSYIAALAPAARQRILDDVAALVADFAEPFDLPYRTDVYWCRRR